MCVWPKTTASQRGNCVRSRASAAGRRPGDVRQPDARAAERPLQAGREEVADPRAVDVAVDRVDRGTEPAQQLEHGDVAQVAGVEDRVGRRALLQAGRRDRAGAARHVRVADDRQPHRAPASQARAPAGAVTGTVAGSPRRAAPR